ncbi:MAG: DUF3500 domain-containing protein [Planctomycetales bacterium]|nr:DUF3500 domain-containing protein [Planctomycetales bacterium]
MRYFLALAVLGLAATLTIATYPLAQEKPAQQTKRKANPALQLVPNAKAFLESLNAEQRAKAVKDFDSKERVDWHFVPLETRKGLPVMEMEGAQKEAAMKLLRASLSQVGYEKATTIMNLESLLRQLEGPGSEARRNPEKYYFTIFGSVAPKKKWGLSIEGHHLSLNFVIQGNTIVSSTPQFFASNPAELKDTYGEKFPKGLRVLKDEEQLAFDLLSSLDSNQKATATLPGDTPKEIRGAEEPQAPATEATGLAAGKLTDAQQATLKKLMEAYTSKMKPLVAKKRWTAIDDAGFDKVHFAWSGASQPGVGHYYRVQGPSFLIEFVNMQPDAAGNPANHIHCVWRDMAGDFGIPVQK